MENPSTEAVAESQGIDSVICRYPRQQGQGDSQLTADDIKIGIVNLLAQVRDGRITEQQFHEATNGAWRSYAESKGGLRLALQKGQGVTAPYQPPKMERYEAGKEYPSSTIYFEHHFGNTAALLKIISPSEINKKNHTYVITP